MWSSAQDDAQHPPAIFYAPWAALIETLWFQGYPSGPFSNTKSPPARLVLVISRELLEETSANLEKMST